MGAVYETEDGKQFDNDKLERKEKCDFCGKLGEVPGDEGLFDGQLPSLHGEGAAGDYANICRECLTEGVDKEKVDEAIGNKEEIVKEHQERSVELS